MGRMPPAVCRFWQQGNCRNGGKHTFNFTAPAQKLILCADRCKFLHTDTNPNSQPLPNGNRYAALQQGDRFGSRASSTDYQSRGARAGSPARELPYSLDKKAIGVDLTSEKPQWILSAYGPGRLAPAQLFGGPMREHSFEEMRLLHYMAVAAGNPQQAIQEAERLWQASEQQIQTAASNIDGDINFIINSEKEHPNRIDIVRGGQAGAGSQPNPFNNQSSFQQQSPAPNPFVGAGQSPQAAPAFGAPSSAAFGAPSALGGAFGQPSALGQKPNAFGGTNPAFGAPTQLGSSGFGQPSALGQRPNHFAASTANTSTPAAAPFSSFAGTSNAFGPPSNAAFGAPSQTTQPNPFGQPSGSNANSNPFGGQSNPQPNPLGGPQPAF